MLPGAAIILTLPFDTVPADKYNPAQVRLLPAARLFYMAIIPEFFINSVTSIGVRNGAGISWTGTGFFIVRVFDAEGNARPMLVTNKHVLANKCSIVLRLKKRDNSTLDIVDAALYENGVKLYYEHPNANVDIAVLPLNGKFITDNNIEFAAFDIDKHAMTSEELRYEGVDEGTLIHMLGFPMGLVNINSNLPICRLGCIARISAAQILESYNILADIQNFPGNSGSPIVTRPEIVSIEGTKSLNKSVLVGIVHSYIPYRENLINSQTQQVVEIRSENSGIALIHPVEFIREVVDEIVKPFNEKANSQNQTEEE